MKYFEARKARIEIIPMIDIMFFMLVFFIMVTLHMIPDAGLRTQLPSSASAQRLPPPKVTVTLASDGSVSVDGRTISTAALTALLAKRPDAAHTVVTIAGAKDVQLQKLVNVMDACRAAGVTQVSLAAEPLAQPKKVN
jgi:biopolymer transport protein ExbD